MCFHTSWKLTMLALTMIGPVIYITGIYAAWSQGAEHCIIDCLTSFGLARPPCASRVGRSNLDSLTGALELAARTRSASFVQPRAPRASLAQHVSQIVRKPCALVTRL